MNALANDLANLIFVVLALGGLCLAVREARRYLPPARRRRAARRTCPSARLAPERWTREMARLLLTGGSVKFK